MTPYGTRDEAKDHRLVLSDPSAGHTAPGAYKGMHALVPILIGLSLPIVLFSLFDPRALGNARLLAHLVMMGVALVAATLFFLTVLNPGNVVQVEVDTSRRTVDLIHSGAFANKVVTLRFDQIQSVRSETAYDDDGYQRRIAVLVMKNRESHQLPDGTTEADVAAISAAIGLR